MKRIVIVGTALAVAFVPWLPSADATPPSAVTITINQHLTGGPRRPECLRHLVPSLIQVTRGGVAARHERRDPRVGELTLLKWVGGIVAGILVGAGVWWLTHPGGPLNPSPRSESPVVTDSPSDTTSPPKPELSFLETIGGEWNLKSWTEAVAPVTLYLDVLDGTMTIDKDAGEASWSFDIQERGESTTPQPGIKCGGIVRISSRQLEGVPGGDRNVQVDWTSDISSIGESVWVTFCGWNHLGETAPFELSFEAKQGEPATHLEMKNSHGTFLWVR